MYSSASQERRVPPSWLHHNATRLLRLHPSSHRHIPMPSIHPITSLCVAAQRKRYLGSPFSPSGSPPPTHLYQPNLALATPSKLKPLLHTRPSSKPKWTLPDCTCPILLATDCSCVWHRRYNSNRDVNETSPSPKP